MEATAQINVRDVLGAQDSVVRQIAAGIRQAVYHARLSHAVALRTIA